MIGKNYTADGVPLDEVDGAAVLDELHGVFTTYCALPCPEAADAVTLWSAGTHAVAAFDAAPRLVVKSATKRSGKTRLLDIVEGTCASALAVMNASTAAVFRSLGDGPPTLIFDEVDTIFGSARVAEQNEELRGLLNAGFQRGRSTLRCVGPQQIPTEFPTFAWAALAGIGSVPDTIADRAVNITMRRRKPGETVRPFRERRDRPRLLAVRAKLAAWLGDQSVIEQLSTAEPETELEDRSADVWEPLLAVADLAGGDWPARARRAATVFTSGTEDEAEDSLSVRLLHDMQEVFRLNMSGFAPTTEVVIPALYKIEDAPWKDDDLTAHKLGRMLREFGIKATRDSTGSKRGYRRADFLDAWERYPIRPDHPSEASESVRAASEQEKRPDTLSDALAGPAEASDEVSDGFPSSGPVLTDFDASDASPAPSGRPRPPSTTRPA